MLGFGDFRLVLLLISWEILGSFFSFVEFFLVFFGDFYNFEFICVFGGNDWKGYLRISYYFFV